MDDEPKDPAGAQQVTITNTQAHIFDSLRGMYGSTRGDVMNTLIQLGIEHVRGSRTVTELLDEARALRAASPAGLVKPRGKKE
jgi:hypothetical protein